MLGGDKNAVVLDPYAAPSLLAGSADMDRSDRERTTSLPDPARHQGDTDNLAGVLGDYKLVMDLRRFEADYAGNALPSAVVEVNAKLVNNRDQRVVASRTFLQQKPAGSVDVSQVATAFEQSLEAATADIAGWVLVSGNGDPKPSR